MDNTKLKGRMNGKMQELQQSPVAVVTSDTSPAPVESTYLALTNNALDIIRANLKSQPPVAGFVRHCEVPVWWGHSV